MRKLLSIKNTAGISTGILFSIGLTVLLLAGTTGCQTPQIRFLQSIHDFGRVPQMREITHTFVFTNTGEGPLHILKVESG